MKWTDEQTAYLVEHYPDTTNDILAAHLNRKEWAVIRRARILGLYKSAAYKRITSQIRYAKQKNKMRGNPKIWTPLQDDLLRLNYGIFSLSRLAEMLGHNRCAVSCRVAKLGLNESQYV